MKNETLYGKEDGLRINERVGVHAEDKYALIRLYCQLFTTGMKKSWPERVYIDLYAGAGYSRIKESGKILQGSPFLALSVDAPFTKYIFCEEDSELLSALEIRVAREFPGANVSYIEGDCNRRVDEIGAEIPRNALELCLVDPFDLSINFETLRKLAEGRRIDFLCLIASSMDGARAHHIYTQPGNTKLDCFFGTTEWRNRFSDAMKSGVDVETFLATEFALRMESIGFKPTPLHRMKEVKSDRNVPLYHLALFSKNPLADKYWGEVLKYSTPQRSLFE